MAPSRAYCKKLRKTRIKIRKIRIKIKKISIKIRKIRITIRKIRVKIRKEDKAWSYTISLARSYGLGSELYN